MTLRLILGALLFAGGLAVRGSEAILAPMGAASATVTQPHETAELIPEKTLVRAGESFGVILHLHSDLAWHTYWINPGDAGLATTIKWTLPPGFTAGPIQWPTPEIHKMGPLVTYGYAGDVYLLTTITTPKNSGSDVLSASIQAEARWLVCQEECIPGQAKLAVTVHVSGSQAILDYKFSDNREFFAAAKARLPVPNTQLDVSANYGAMGGLSPAAQGLYLLFKWKPDMVPLDPGQLQFFPEQSNVLSTQPKDSQVIGTKPDPWEMFIALQQNGEKPTTLSGILVSDRAFIGDAKAVYISSFPTNDKSVPMVMHAAGSSTPVAAAPAAQGVSDGHRPPLQGEARSGSAELILRQAQDDGRGKRVPSAADGATPHDPTLFQSEVEYIHSQPWLVTILGGAFLGGLILNLMPCVLPVLSLKVFSLMRHAGDDPRAAWKQGAAFTTGVVISFWILAGLLIALRAAGNHLGWGFQMQSPGFVLALIFLFFLLGLNLFGVFALGTSLVGLDARASGHVGSGLPSSFLNGALATLAATPCTAPFMGSSVGFAAEQPAWVAMLVFTVLALGMATPYLLLTIFPGALRFVPKPGAWMEAFRQFMGFLLMATVIFLVYVFGALVGEDQVPDLLAALLVAGVGAWIYGRWGTAIHSDGARSAAVVLALIAMAVAIFWGSDLAQATPAKVSSAALAGDWQPWTPAAVDQALAQGHPVFVDFTAAWCLSCKVNERVALETDAVKAAFAEKKVALFRADWTHADPAISDVLQRYHRDGVPLYLFYTAGATSAPQVLPEVLTPGIVLDALGR